MLENSHDRSKCRVIKHSHYIWLKTNIMNDILIFASYIMEWII